VLALVGKTAFKQCDLGGPNIDALLWEVPRSRRLVVGAIGAIDCTFQACTFIGVGYAGPPDMIAKFRNIG
jgi:hypothetical protein